MRIRFITATPMNAAEGSGTYVGISTLMNALRRAGAEVSLTTPSLHLPVFTAERLLFNRRLRPSRADLTVGFDMDGYALAGTGGAHIASIKGVIADEMRFERGLTRLTMSIQARYERRHVRSAGMVLATSRYSAGKIADLYGKPERLALTPELIDLDVWEKAIGAAPARPASGEFTVLSVGRFFPRKRTSVLLEAAAALRHRLPGLRVRLVGDGPEGVRLRALHERLRLGDRAVFLGHLGQAAVAAEYRNCDLFATPASRRASASCFWRPWRPASRLSPPAPPPRRRWFPTRGLPNRTRLNHSPPPSKPWPPTPDSARGWSGRGRKSCASMKRPLSPERFWNLPGRPCRSATMAGVLEWKKTRSTAYRDQVRRKQHLFVKAVAADAQIPIDSPGRQHGLRFLEERLDSPSVPDPHAFRMPHGDCFVNRISFEGPKDIFERAFEEVPNRLLCLQAARIDVSIGIDTHFGTAEALRKEVQPTRPAIAEVPGEIRRGESVSPGAPAGPELADPLIRCSSEEMIVAVPRGPWR